MACDLLRRRRVQPLACAEQSGTRPGFLCSPANLVRDNGGSLFCILRRDHRLCKQSVERHAAVLGIEHVGQLVDAKLLENPCKLLFQHLADTKLNRIGERKVHGPHYVLLSDAIDTTDALCPSSNALRRRVRLANGGSVPSD